jgi:DNA-binding MarR family transcriptional regulator
MDTAQQLALGLERLAELLRAQAWKQQQQSGLNPTQQSVLRRLAEHDDGLRLSQLAGLLGVSAASLSDSVSSLERRGEVLKKPDPDDGRASRLRLSAAGKRRLLKLQRSPSPAAGLVEALNPRQQGDLLALLQLLIAQAQDQGLATGFRTCLGCRFFRPHAHGHSDQPHHCDLLDRAFGQQALRIDCAERQPAPPELAAIAANLFRSRSPQRPEPAPLPHERSTT